MKYLFILLFSFVANAQNNSIVGKWKTIDDKTNEPKSIVEIYEEDGQFKAKVVQIFLKPTEDQNPVCKECSDDRKDKPVLGMQIMQKLKKDSETEWSGGKILDPKNGKTYSCKAELIEEGKKLKMRGYIGFSLLGRTQVWERQ